MYSVAECSLTTNYSKIDAILFNLPENEDKLIQSIQEKKIEESPEPEKPKEIKSLNIKNIVSKHYTISNNKELDGFLDEVRRNIKAYLDSGKIIKIIE